jgi:DNA-binding transcriptional LysR family regulator
LDGSSVHRLTLAIDMTLDLHQLRCFVTVAEELHFGRAAVRLNMTQPPLSRQIQLLEHTLDAPLFDRTSRSVRLTPSGRGLLVEARRILKLAASAVVVAKRIASGKSGLIKIGFTAGAAYSFLPKLISICRARLPEIELVLREMVSTDQIEALASGQIDIGLVRPPIAHPELDAIRVFSEPLLAAVPKGHKLARKKTLMIRDLDAQPFVMYSPFESRYFYDLLVTQFTTARILPRYVQHLSQIHSVLALVRAGLGLALVPSSAAALRFTGVVLRPIQLRPVRPVELFLTWRRDHDVPALPTLLGIVQNLSRRAGS